MVNPTNYHNDTKKVIKKPLFHVVIWLCNWSIWVSNTLAKGYKKKSYETLCDEEDITPLYRITGYFLAILCAINLAYLIFILVFYMVRRKHFANIVGTPQDTQMTRTQEARHLYHKTSNIMALIDGLYRVVAMLLCIIVIGFASRIIYIFNNETCSAGGWDYFVPIAIIVIAILVLIVDCFSLIFDIHLWKDRVTDLEMPESGLAKPTVTPGTPSTHVDQLDGSTVSSSISVTASVASSSEYSS